MSVPNLLDYPPTVPRLIDRCISTFGSRDFVVSPAARFCYRDLGERSRYLAQRLLASGVGKGTRVGLLMTQDHDWITAYWATARIGAVAVTISTFAQPPELRALLRHSDVHLLLMSARIRGKDQCSLLEAAIPGLSETSGPVLQMADTPYLRAVWVMGPSDRSWATPIDWHSGPHLPPAELLAAVESEVSPADPLVIIYTSGTSADPKGVILTHGSVVRHGENLHRLGLIVDGDRVFAGMPFFWVGGLSFTLTTAMHAGATLLIQEPFEPGAALELMDRERATNLTGWPTLVQALIAHPSLAQRDLSALVRGPLAAALHQGEALISMGMTETSASHSIGLPGQTPSPSELPGVAGYAVPGLFRRIVDPVSGQVLPPKAEGELCVRGYSLMAGMVKKERHEIFDADGWYHTGDGGYLTEDGLLVFTGRLSEMIKTRGMNVAPAEVEAALLGHPRVAQAYVFGVPDPEAGQRVIGAVVFRPPDGNLTDTGPGLPELAQWLKGKVASYKIPSQVMAVDADEVPMLASRKVDKRALAKLALQRLSG
jgi:acyl-CoA synthetase (AMP-forming)/AMP-acid ligase II